MLKHRAGTLWAINVLSGVLQALQIRVLLIPADDIESENLSSCPCHKRLHSILVEAIFPTTANRKW